MTGLLDTVPQWRGAKLIAAIVGIVIMAAFLGWLLWYIIVRPGTEHRAAVQAKADAGASKVQAETARDATATGERIQIVHDRIERTTRENTIRIAAAPGAGDPVPAGVAGELDRALGMRDAYHDADAGERVPVSAAAVGTQQDTRRAPAR